MTNLLTNIISVNKDPLKIAVIDGQDRTYSYQHVNDLINGVANGLTSAGYVAQDRIAILSTNSVEFIASYFGILKIGAVAVMVNAQLPESQISYILNDSQAKLLFTDQTVAVTIPTIKYNELDTFANNKQHHIPCVVSELDPAVIMYTSGSTGRPKGVILSHRGHNWIIATKAQDIKEDSCIIVAAPCYHMNGLSNMQTALSSHATLVLLPKYNAKEFIHAIDRHRVTFVSGSPTMMSMALSEPGLVENANLDSVTDVWLGSAPLGINLINSIKKYFKNATVTNSYGMTESGPKIFARSQILPNNEISAGYPVQHPELSVRIVDGILQVRSPSKLIGYTNNTPRMTEDGYFITNDRFKIDELGAYYFLGRADDMFVSGGNNIYPRELESALESHPNVVVAVTVDLPDNIKGCKPYAFVTVDASCTEEELKTHALLTLPRSHCPRKIWIIDSMPLNSIGKIDKLALKSKALLLLQ
jgi:acyl-CoA synthetase (AMP-forming)/AMP-acid ligase II